MSRREIRLAEGKRGEAPIHRSGEMSLRDLYEEYRARIRFSDLDLASRSIALLWLEKFEGRVFRTCFPQVRAPSLRKDLAALINQAFLEGYILGRAAHRTGTEPILFSRPEVTGSVEGNLILLTSMYERAELGSAPVLEERPEVESVARHIILEITRDPLLLRLEERDLVKLNLEYALKAGYSLVIFERRVMEGKDRARRAGQQGGDGVEG